MINNNCNICFEPINDPICIYCYIKQIRNLLRDKGLNVFVTRFIINKLKNKFTLEWINETDCLLCKKESISICFFCFSKIMINTLEELNFSEQDLENFREIFRYNSSEYETSIALKKGYQNIFEDIN